MQRKSEPNDSRSHAQQHAEWQDWKRIVRESPVVRAEKIAHSRTAIASGAFDADAVIEDTLDKMMDAMGIRFHD